MKNKIKRFILTIIGITLLGCGVGMSIKVGLGVDPVNAFYDGLAKLLNISVGQITTIFNVILLILTLIIDYKKIGLATLILVLCVQYPIDLAYFLFTPSSIYFLNLIFMMLSFLLIAFACCLVISGGLGMGIYDAFVFGISDRFKIPFIYSRYGVDFFFLVCAILVGGQLGIGTIVSFVVMGPFINFFKKILSKLIQFEA